MLRPVAGWVLRLLLALALVPVGLLTVAACKPCPPGVKADLRADGGMRTDDDDVDIGDLLKQSEEDKKKADPVNKKPGQTEPNGGVNARGNGGPPAACPPAVGKPRNSGGEFNKNLFGAKGAKTPSESIIPRRPIGKDTTFRMDVENPRPGYVEGNIHVQLGGQGSTKYYWRGGTKFTDEFGNQLPKAGRKWIESNMDYVKGKIQHGLSMLGEKK
jgi:hypothetical protein